MTPQEKIKKLSRKDELYILIKATISEVHKLTENVSEKMHSTHMTTLLDKCEQLKELYEESLIYKN